MDQRSIRVSGALAAIALATAAAVVVPCLAIAGVVRVEPHVPDQWQHLLEPRSTD